MTSKKLIDQKMNESVFKLEFYGRRRLSSSRKNTYFIIGAIESIIGLFGLLKSNMILNPFYTILLIGGTFSIVYGLIGIELIKERNSISIKPGEIEFKNSFKKLQRLQIHDLLDVSIETQKVEFVLKGQEVKSYNFSVFTDQELDNISKELHKIKSNTIN